MRESRTSGIPEAKQLRVMFILAPSRAFGEINVVMPLAESLAQAGARVWIFGSPLAVRVARKTLPDRVFEMGPNRTRNQTVFWRLVKKFGVNLLVFSEFYELLQPRRQTECPLLDARFFAQASECDATMAFIDFIAHAPVLRELADCRTCARSFGGAYLRSFFQRLWAVLPCPLNEPSPVPGRIGIPYVVSPLPIHLNPDERSRIRQRFLGSARRAADEILLVRTGSTWQAKLAKELGHPLYQHLTHLLSIYLRSLKTPVTLVTISDQDGLAPDPDRRLRTVHVSNLPPEEFERLILSADAVLTDNQIGYTLAKVIGSVPGIVLVNSCTSEEIFARERYGSPVWRIVSELEQKRPGSVYPHHIFPLPVHTEAPGGQNGKSSPFEPATVRLGRMASSPYIKAEIFGGASTSRMMQWLLADRGARDYLKQVDREYLGRLDAVEDGATVLQRIRGSECLAGNTVG